MKPHIDDLPTEIPPPPVPDISEGCFINSDDIISSIHVLSHIAGPLECNLEDTLSPQRNVNGISAGIWPYNQSLTVNRKSSGSRSSDNLNQFSTCLALQLHYGNPYRDTKVCNIKLPVCKFKRLSWHSHTYMDAEVGNILPYEATNRINLQCKWIMPEPRSPNILFF